MWPKPRLRGSWRVPREVAEPSGSPGHILLRFRMHSRTIHILISFISGKIELAPALFSGDGHAVDADRGTGNRAAKFEIVADFRDVSQHFLQVSGDRDLLDGVG